MAQTGGHPVLNKYFKSCLISGMILLTAGMPAQACFPEYEQYRNSIELNPEGAPYYLEQHNGKSYEQLVTYNVTNYSFDLQLVSLPLEQYQLIKMGRSLNDSSSNRLGLYPLKNNKVQGYVLLETVDISDACAYDLLIQSWLQDKHLVNGYLPGLPIPPGLELQFYEKIQGKFVERVALLVKPNQDFRVPPYVHGQTIVMKSRYRIELEPFIKPEIQRYFEHNLSDWAWHAEP